MIDVNDWRLQSQEKYLKDKVLFYKQYADRTTSTDHDHCGFCRRMFSETISDGLKVGYTTSDDYHWTCTPCFEDFKELFHFTIGNN